MDISLDYDAVLFRCFDNLIQTSREEDTLTLTEAFWLANESFLRWLFGRLSSRRRNAGLMKLAPEI